MKTTLMGLRLVCLMLFFASAFGAETLDRRIDAAPNGIVSIENTAGSVEVRGWSRNEVEVTGELGSDVDELVFERDGNTVVVHVRSGSGSNPDISSDLVIRVPEQSGVNINGVSTDVEVRDVRGAQRLKTVSGDVDTQAFASDVDIEAISGDIAIEGDGEASRTRLNSVSGDIEAENLAGEIQANAVSGDLTVVGSRFERVHAESVSGDIVFRAALLDSGRMDMETINGEIDLVFDGDVSARFDIETFNGDIRNCFGPEPERTSRYTPGLELSFVEGDGDARVTIHTLNGDLRLCKD